MTSYMSYIAWAPEYERHALQGADHQMRLEEICLLHDPQELLLVHFPIAIPIGFINHLLQFLICHALTKLLRDALEILKRDLPSFVIVKQTESLQDLVLRVAIEDLVCHHLEKFFIFNGATSIIINVGNHFLDLLLLWFETQCAHGNLQLFRIDGA